MKEPKNEQLRVRLTEELRLALENYARQQGGHATVSSVLREFIQWLVDSKGNRRPKLVSREAAEVLTSLSKECGRNEEQTLDECIFGIRDLLDESKSPQIVKEIRMRRRYFQEQSEETPLE